MFFQKNGKSASATKKQELETIEKEEEDVLELLKKLEKAIKELSDSFDKHIKEEIRALKAEVQSRNTFMEQVVIKLLDKPVLSPPKTAVEIYQENKEKQRREEATKNKRLPG